MTGERTELITPNMVLTSIQRQEKGWRKEFKEILRSDRRAEALDFVERATTLYGDLEALAFNPTANYPKTAEEANRIKAIWVKSAHGTYLMPTKDDRFKGKAWAVNNDRDRMNYGLGIARVLAELKSGQVLSGNWEEDREVLMEYGPAIIYAGRWDENRDIRIASSYPLRYFPKDKLYPTENFLIVDGQINNTADVIRNFRVPQTYNPMKGDEIAVVCHSPQAVRFLFMLQEIESHFPEQATVKIFPMPTPNGGLPEYPIQELRGTTYYRFISNPQLAADKPYPWV